MEEALIRVKDLCKIYNPGENEVRALDHINLEINKGEFVAIIGQPTIPACSLHQICLSSKQKL